MLRRSNHKCAHAGFTLVELSISVLLIGLLLTMIVKGTELVQNTKFKKTIATVNDITAAAMAFKQKYDVMPGDMNNAVARIPNCAMDCAGGNNDGSIGVRNDKGVSDQTGSALPQIETTLFWKHLAKADFLNNVNPDADVNSPAMGQTHPRSPMGGVFAVYNRGGTLHGLSVKFTPNGDAGFLSSQKTLILDTMVDETPDPSKGNLKANGGPGCSITNSTYLPDDSFAYCYVFFDAAF